MVQTNILGSEEKINERRGKRSGTSSKDLYERGWRSDKDIEENRRMAVERLRERDWENVNWGKRVIGNKLIWFT